MGVKIFPNPFTIFAKDSEKSSRASWTRTPRRFFRQQSAPKLWRVHPLIWNSRDGISPSMSAECYHPWLSDW